MLSGSHHAQSFADPREGVEGALDLGVGERRARLDAQARRALGHDGVAEGGLDMMGFMVYIRILEYYSIRRIELCGRIRLGSYPSF